MVTAEQDHCDVNLSRLLILFIHLSVQHYPITSQLELNLCKIELNRKSEGKKRRSLISSYCRAAGSDRCLSTAVSALLHGNAVTPPVQHVTRHTAAWGCSDITHHYLWGSCTDSHTLSRSRSLVSLLLYCYKCDNVHEISEYLVDSFSHEQRLVMGLMFS